MLTAPRYSYVIFTLSGKCIIISPDDVTDQVASGVCFVSHTLNKCNPSYLKYFRYLASLVESSATAVALAPGPSQLLL